MHPFVVQRMLWFGLAITLAGCGGSGSGGSIAPSDAGGVVGQRATSGPRSSASASLSGDDKILVVANQDCDSVTVFDVQGDKPQKLAEIPVGFEPRSVAVTADGKKAYVAETLAGSVAVVSLTEYRVVNRIKVGLEPRAVILSPNEHWLYVANSVSNDISVVATSNDQVFVTLAIPREFGSQPRALAETDDGDLDDLDETVFIPLFFSELRQQKTGLDEGQDDNREGRVALLRAGNQVISPVRLEPVANTGFNGNGSEIDFIGTHNGQGGVDAQDPKNPEDATFPTSCFPNQLAAIAIHPTKGYAYVVSTGASPNGPFKFNVNAQGLVSVIDTVHPREIRSDNVSSTVFQKAPLNLDEGIKNDTSVSPVLFHTNPIDMAWRPDGSEAWVLIQQSGVLVRLLIDKNGIPTINAPLQPGAGSLVRLDLENPGQGLLSGKAPRSLVINHRGDRAFVSNFITRSVSVVDLDAHEVIATARSASLPAPGTPDATVHLGAELFFSSRGPDGRMSQEAWGGCIVCHADGLSDNVTWMFDTGPRQTIPLDGMFDRNDTLHQRILNWSAVRDENQDFELNTRGVFGGRGLIEDDRPMFLVGGASGSTPSDSDDILQYHQALNTVGAKNVLAGNAFLPPIIAARRDFAMATLPDGRIFIIGGRAGAGQGNLVSANDAVLEFDPFANEVRRKSSVGFTLRHSLGAAAVQTAQGPRIYAIGGYASTSGSAAPVVTVEEYNPSTDTWSADAPLPAGLAQFGIAATSALNKGEPDSFIQALGGNTGSESSPTVTGSVLRFLANPAGTGTWSTLAVKITARRNLGGGAIVRGAATHVFAIGGQDGSGHALATVEEFKVADPTVLVTPMTQLPGALHSFGIATAVNRVYIAGGVDQNGLDVNTVLELNPAANPAAGTPGDPGEPSGVFTAKTTLPVAARSLQISSPPPVANFLPVANSGRDPRQDAINEWIKRVVRSQVAPNHGRVVKVGRELFGREGLTGIANVSCATCHGTVQWTRSLVDFISPPSPDLAHGAQEISGAELTKTASQPGDAAHNGVLVDVGTFLAYDPVAKTGRINEVRPDPADVGHRLASLGAKGFNIPSLLSVAGTAPYFHNGMAATLDDVLNGKFDGQGSSSLKRVHFVQSAEQRADLIEFLESIDQSTPAFP